MMPRKAIKTPPKKDAPKKGEKMPMMPSHGKGCGGSKKK